MKSRIARAERANHLAGRYPHAKEALDFYRHLIEFQGDREALRALVMRHGPALLREAAGGDKEPALTFFERVLLRQSPPAREAPHSNRCPCCGQPPQAGVLHVEGHGTALHLMCSLCLAEWPFPRSLCPFCGVEGKLACYGVDLLPHIQTQTCDSCRRYLHMINLEKAPEACPDVDEIAALPLDVWALENGYEKIHPNLIGI
jgi:FdhE protein